MSKMEHCFAKLHCNAASDATSPEESRNAKTISSQTDSSKTSKTALKNIRFKLVDLWKGAYMPHLPCNGMEKVNYEVSEYDLEEANPAYLEVILWHRDLTYKEVKMKRVPSIAIGQFIKSLVLLQNKCVLYAQWLSSSASKARLGFRHLSSRLVKSAPLERLVMNFV